MKFHKCIPPIFSSFRYKLLLAFLIATMVPLISLTFISYHISYNIARDRIIDSAVMTDKQLVSQLNDRLGQVENCLLYTSTCDLTCIFGSLTLSIVEVSRNCDNCLCYFLTKICLCILFQFLKDHCGDLLWRIFLVIDGYTVIGTHLSFDRGDRSVCICNCLTFCRLTYQTLSCFCECYNGWCCSCLLYTSRCV